MWVLEARKDAEVIWYSIVWEESKEASNVIDYNINSEQTKDIASEINANNQTTTGMANVIPWINAPKLLADTSIIWWEWWWGWWFKAKIVEFTSDMTLVQAQAILDTYLNWYFTIPVLNISDAAYRYYYPWYMHYNHITFIFTWEDFSQQQIRIDYSWTTATAFTERWG